MKRWNFVSGLTIILLLLLVLSGFSVAVIRSLTGDLDKLIASNYDTIRAIREIRDSTTRMNAHYRKANLTSEIPTGHGIYEHERKNIEDGVDFVLAQAQTPAERRRAELLGAFVRDYLGVYESYLGLRGLRSAAGDERFATATSNIAQLTGEISNAAADVINDQERQIFDRRDHAVARGKQATTLALVIVAFSLVVYVLTSMRLTRGVYQPLRDLRDAIARVRERRFEEPIRADGSEELGQIATAFNAMSHELRVYVTETDEKAVQAARDCRAILAALPYPVYIVDETLDVRMSNPRGEELAAAAGVPGALPAAVRRQIDLAAERGCDLVDNDMHRVIEGVGEAENDGRGQASYLPQVFRLVDSHGSREGWAVLLVDVTKLRRLDEAKTKALSTLGHEVKTPVTGIRMSLHLLLEEKLGSLNDDQRELIAAGRDDCERLLSVLQSLLELARLESGRAVFKLEPTPADRLLAQADAMHGEFVRQNGMTLVAPESVEGMAPVSADLIHAGRVLGNFLSNAAKYGAKGGEVRLSATERADGFVRFSVSNPAARPLSEAEQLRIFDPFYRRPGEKAEGSGLGLTIAREIAAAHGGRIGVWCEGGRVEFYLDLRKVSTAYDAGVSDESIFRASAPAAPTESPASGA
jgi:NtrC-family two-component system sensor histidine kinase KinB